MTQIKWINDRKYVRIGNSWEHPRDIYILILSYSSFWDEYHPRNIAIESDFSLAPYRTT